MSMCIIIPARDAEATLAGVVTELRAAIPEYRDGIIVVDDGSRDGTARLARELGCTLASTKTERGKGAALLAGLEVAHARGTTIALTVDADGQHPADEARRVLFATEEVNALVLGVRDLARAGAPRANRFSNGISNFFLSRFAGRPLLDTQCGLRRYPIAETLALRARGRGFDFEAEVLLRAIRNGLSIVEVPVRVLYPEDRQSHFRIRRDVTRIIQTVLETVSER